MVWPTHYTFTLNNPNDFRPSFNPNTMWCLFYQEERGEKTGTHHLQGFVAFRNPTKMERANRNYFDNRASFKIADGTVAENIRYCSKTRTAIPNTFKSFGDTEACPERNASNPENQGRRVDLQKVVDIVKSTHSLKRVAEECPAEFIKFHRGIEALSEQLREKPKFSLPGPMKDWQIRIMDDIKQAPNERTVTWIVDTEGGAGKSTFTKYLLANTDACILPMKLVEAMYLYNGERVVIFDLVRSTEEICSYSTIETIKNGVFTSTKYVPKFKFYPSPHVLVFSNWEPNREKLSADRWDIRHIQSFPWNTNVTATMIDLSEE